MISDRRLFLTATGEAVEDGHPNAHTLLVGKGCFIHDQQAANLGLIPKTEPAKTTEPGEAAKAVAPAEDKAIKSPPQNKAVAPAEDK